jgi:integrase
VEDDHDDDDGTGSGEGSGSGGGDGSGSGASGGDEAGSSSNASRSRSRDDPPTGEEDEEPPEVGGSGARRRLPAIELSATAKAQLQAFQRWRCSTVNRQRSGKAVASVTSLDDRRSLLHFFAWLHHAHGVAAPSFGVFASPKIGAVVQAFVEEKTLSCSYSRATKLVGTLLAAARFTHAARQAQAASGVVVSSAPVDELAALHAQCRSEARQEAKFNVTTPPKAWLTWEECQRARLRAERAADSFEGDDDAERLSLVRDAALLKLLTALPPDRVGVYRQLQLGGSLKALGGGSFQIDLGERGSHKTSEVFGPSRTTLTEAVASRIHVLVALDGLQSGDFLFHAVDRRAAPSPTAWTRLVQAAFQAHSGVALSPKDCRASFVTFLKDGDHGDEALRAAAKAMRHSSAMADSAAYDKHGSDRVVAAAVSVADAFARRFA